MLQILEITKANEMAEGISSYYQWDVFLTCFTPTFHFHTPWKLKDTCGSVTFSGGKKVVQRPEMS